MTHDLDQLEALLVKATPGPWRNERTGDEETVMRIIHGRRSAGGSEVCIVTTGSYNDATEAGNAALIVAAVNALPALIARVRELKQEQATLRAALAIAQEDRRAAALAMRERCAVAVEDMSLAHEPRDEHDARRERTLRHCAAAIRALEP